MHAHRRTARSERGAAAVEFALVMPILIALVFGMIDFGWAINRYTVVNNAAREAVRTASLGGDDAAIRASAQNSMDSTISSPVITITCQETPTGGVCPSPWVAGNTAVVTVQTTQSWLTPLMSTFSSNLVLTKTSRMRIE